MRHAAAVAALALLGACSAPDYTPVRGWAEAAVLAVDYPAAASPPPGQLSRPPTGGEVAALPGPAVLAQQEALATWFLALAILAGDGVLPWRDDPLASVAPRAGAAGQAIVAELGALLRRAARRVARAPEMRDTLVAADPLVQRLLVVLQAGMGPDALAAARAGTGTVHDALADAAPGQVVRQPLPDPDAVRARYTVVLRRLAEGHAMLARRAPGITHEAAVQEIGRAEDALARAQAALPRALPPSASPRPTG